MIYNHNHNEESYFTYYNIYFKMLLSKEKLSIEEKKIKICKLVVVFDEGGFSLFQIVQSLLV